ncbi:hypothetical protein Bra471DRAFT_01487 [Bradyrhizobium sp. WSM471]|nr:hypothetical protein Bra471DRAFT_01487 [Bradyrhizobium sp. WSM471]
MVSLPDKGGAVRHVPLRQQRTTGARKLLACVNLAPASAMRQHGQLAFKSLANLSSSDAAIANSDKGGVASLGAALWQPDPGWMRLRAPVRRRVDRECFASQQGTGVSLRARGHGTCVRRMGYGPGRPSPHRRRPNCSPALVSRSARLGSSRRRGDRCRSAGFGPAGGNRAPARRMPSRRVGTPPSCWSARPDCVGARPAHSRTGVTVALQAGRFLNLTE